MRLGKKTCKSTLSNHIGLQDSRIVHVAASPVKQKFDPYLYTNATLRRFGISIYSSD